MRHINRQWIYRGLVILASLCFLHVFPSVLFVVYMGSRGFFDYEFFQQGLFALNVFYGTAELFVICLALMMFGAIIPWWQRVRHKTGSRTFVAVVTAANVVVVVYLAQAIVHRESGSIVSVLVLFLLSICIALHMAVVMHERAESALYSLLTLFAVVGALVGIAPREVASLLSLGLQVYNAGGGVRVVVHDGAQHNEGALIFLGPRYVYVAFKGATVMSVLPRSETLMLQFTRTKRDLDDEERPAK